MLLAFRTITCLQDEFRFILIQGLPALGGICRCSRKTRVIMDIVTLVIILESFVTDETPSVISAFNIVASFRSQSSDSAVRTLLELAIFGIF